MNAHVETNKEKFLDQMIKVKNDLQVIVENENDSVRQALHLLSNLKNCFSFSMSGSGPTCFAIFNDVDTANSSYT